MAAFGRLFMATAISAPLGILLTAIGVHLYADSKDVGRYLHDVGYGCQWWSASAGSHHFDYAWRHGGQLIILLDDLDMIVVVNAYPFYLQHDDESWKHERANINTVGKFIESLPNRWRAGQVSFGRVHWSLDAIESRSHAWTER